MSAARGGDSVQSRTDRLAEEAGDAIRQIGNKVEGNLQDAGESLAKAQKLLTQQAQMAADATDDYVHENPWKAVAIAGAAGLLVGLLFNIRR